MQTIWEVPLHGNYIDGLTMNPNGKWLELNADGTELTFLQRKWTKWNGKIERGKSFTMTIAGKMVGAGTLQGNELVEMMGWNTRLFRRNRSGRAGGILQQWFFCHVYLLWKPVCGSVSHRPFPARSSWDCLIFTQKTGVKGWITKLDTEERVTEWLAGFDEKETNENVQDYQTMEYTVAGYPARAIVYQTQRAGSEVIVNFGKDMGNETYSMYAAYLLLQGIRMYPYGMKIQGMINSLHRWIIAGGYQCFLPTFSPLYSRPFCWPG